MLQSDTYKNWKHNLKSGWKRWTWRKLQDKQWYRNYKSWEREYKRRRGDTYRQKRSNVRRVESIRRNYGEDASAVMEQVPGYTMIPDNALYAVIETVRYVIQWKIPGAFVECGIWRRGATM